MSNSSMELYFPFIVILAMFWLVLKPGDVRMEGGYGSTRLALVYFDNLVLKKLSSIICAVLTKL